MDKLRAIHDQLLLAKPEEAVHDEGNCPFCSEDNSNRGGDMTYTEEEFNAAVAAAVAPVQAELDALKAAQAEGEVDDRVAKAEAEAASKIAAIQAELDEAMAKLGAVEQANADIHAFLAAEVEAAEEAARLEALKSERLATVKDLAVFDEEYIESNLERWVAQDDEDFAALVESWKKAAEAASAGSTNEPVSEKIPETAMFTTNDVAGTEADSFAAFLGARKAFN